MQVHRCSCLHLHQASWLRDSQGRGQHWPRSLGPAYPVSSQAGRSSKRQLFFLPGGLERHLKIKTCTVSEGTAPGGGCWRGRDTPVSRVGLQGH